MKTHHNKKIKINLKKKKFSRNEITLKKNKILFFGCNTRHAEIPPYPGIEPMLPALETWSLTHWTTREVPEIMFNWVEVSELREKKPNGF